MIKTYHKTTTIKVEQFDGSNEMVEKYKMMDAGTMIGTQHSPELYLEGSGKVVIGDWIATGVNGEHWTIADDIFKQRCEELPVIPKSVADWIEECKQKHISIGDMLCSERRPEQMRDWMALTPGTYQFDYARYHKYQELVAKAWLEGYQVEAQHDTRTD
ncbi:hypothetical protein Lb_30 [Lactobacillus phage Lb]|uniref:DUF1642 domain-containing protein n=1 Tax=Lactobacillus phage Lb TaxID=2048517 RepID=A0A2Z2UBZ9_9CAUD|nr:DUF1642 domain-containing protein [Lactobacillus phage Lb]ATN94194.1 hypothetical protein Lb_30 [Lactobacillus phage Lb]